MFKWAQKVLTAQLNETGIPADWRALEAATKALSQFTLPPCINGCTIGDYRPDIVRYRLRNWRELVDACNGMSAAGAEPIGSAGEVDARRDQIAMLADLQQGTDEALWSILNWRAAERIYSRQGRLPRYRQRRATFLATWRDELTKEPTDTNVAEGVCIERISRALGWYEHECEGK